MKQKIKNSCFSKMKRVALALFAALCVGSVWGANRGVFWSKPPTVSLSPTGLITITDANNYTWNQSNSGLTKDQYNTAVNNLKCTDTMDYTLHTVDGQEITKTVTVKAQYAVNSVGWHGINIDLGGPYTYQIEDWAAYQISSVDIRFTAALNKTVSSTIDYENLANRQTFAYDYTFEMKGVLSTSSTWDADSSKFVITGDALDSSVRVKYAIGGDELTASSELATMVDVEVSGTAYRLEIPYTDETKLVYSVYAIDGDTESVFVNVEGKSVFVLKKWDNARVTYTWASESVGNWTDSKNWTSDITPAYGYPGTKGEKYFFTSVRFESDAEVNLENGTYTLKDGGASLYFASGANVLLKNGNLGLMPEGMGDNEYALGGNGAVVEYRDVKLIYSAENTGLFDLAFADGSTNIFAGSIDHPWNYLPLYANTKLVFKDGEISTEYSKSTFSNLSSQEVEINNAKWTIKVSNSPDGAKSGIAGLVKFRDGADRQARLVVNSKKVLKLQGTYDFVLSSDREYTHYVEAGNAFVAETKDNAGNVTGHTTYKCNIKVDATALVGEATVPLMKFTAVNNYTEETMAEMVDPANNYLKVIVDGKEVDNSKYGASLVWEDNILYYQQVEPKVAAITKTETDDAGNETEVTTEYATLGEAIAAANGDTIKLLADIEAPTAFVIGGESGAKTVTIDLNGKTVKANDTAAASDGNGVFWVRARGVLTLEDSSEDKSGTVDGNGGNDYKMAIWADGGKVVINGGNYVNENDGTHTQYDLIYAKNDGEIVINGGTFKCDTPPWTLNSHNTKTGRFIVTGGKFYQYNPTDFDTDEAVTTWCDAKYRAEADGDWFVVKAGYTLTVEEPSVIVKTQEDANAVELNVVAPEDFNDTEKEVYLGCFEKVTSNVEGGLEVKLALKEDVKPLIGESAADAGDAFTVDAENVVITIQNYVKGLNYGVRSAAEITKLNTEDAVVEKATVTDGKIMLKKSGDTKFYKVIVDFNEIKESTEAE